MRHRYSVSIRPAPEFPGKRPRAAVRFILFFDFDKTRELCQPGHLFNHPGRAPRIDPTGTSIDLSSGTLSPPTPTNLIDALNELLLHGTMSDGMRQEVIRDAVATYSGLKSALARDARAIYLIVTSSQYQVQR